MAFRDVSKGTSGLSGSKKVTELDIGAELVGFVTGFEPSLQDPENKNLIMRLEDGSKVRVYTAGNLKYIVKDGKIQEGLLTKIVRIDDKMIKGKRSSQFQVLQDPDSTIDDALLNEIGTPPPAKVSEAAVSTAKSRAEALARAASKRG